tara:strand:- start:28 stop:243 length:216 start_codon:yes stop_codon:yes gene_type:complete
MNKDELKKAKEQLIQDYKWKMWLKDWEKRNLIPFDSYFKYSGEVEETKYSPETYTFLKYNKNGKNNKTDDE